MTSLPAQFYKEYKATMPDPNEQVDWDATAEEEVKEYFETLLPDDDNNNDDEDSSDD